MKRANAQTIQLEKSRGNILFVRPETHGVQFEVPCDKFIKGDLIRSSITVYRNASVARWASNISNYLARAARFIDPFNRFVIDEAFVDEFIARIDAANKEIRAESEAFVAAYDDHVAAFQEKIMEACRQNRKVKQSKVIIKAAMQRFPTKSQILSSCITYTMDTDGTEAYEHLLESTKELVDQSKLEQAEQNRCRHLANRCGPVLENLIKFSHQIAEGKLHGGTINSYTNAVDDLKIANEVELSAPLPELTEFIKISTYAVDHPVVAIDAFIMGFMRFYYTQGMLDYIPYKSLDEAYNRALVEEIGQDSNNSFSAISDTLPKQISMFD